MRDREKNKEMEEHRQALLDARGEILGRYNSEKEQRIQWLVKFIDIEDELEELSRRQSQWVNLLTIE
ncbi:hypothetical protein [Desulfosporosinus sp. BICA1-9]|uniref:hypothetical protein n=1 Tax=Desulfosporosinus sp. BICA1-9 TaxID=1531958 RepID=UPI00054BBD86|nr:hypothetical protein [Desulfosporosinus sp. BICA1-9]KJS50894.1 MAG: hypothetical protein VR66_00280 [Peptococcaceae bacterium BRH_c23]KJS86532.1 MAG: hypothetical protein JL57_16100 [Desulfosporosinus sp. BICA1-9]HBW36910.1 hypothetical protein [Desulfosporosinus sp.]